ncbi:unnamed protein product [Vitrella brassicaformis CCMP3155]|uniref:protein-tyrosine-phosphatase n=2 Tax=Vitrella brassicaformis TaxID=1169539 RepID=A0A0G4EJA5_VITBC|nr:unnamed protein product [Vitrella brassicaformis CCMP3155]|eukprot:CEL96799.1 unnamed protein product [Vitrella brassicaformis CCMP3155]
MSMGLSFSSGEATGAHLEQPAVGRVTDDILPSPPNHLTKNHSTRPPLSNHRKHQHLPTTHATTNNNHRLLHTSSRSRSRAIQNRPLPPSRPLRALSGEMCNGVGGSSCSSVGDGVCEDEEPIYFLWDLDETLITFQCLLAEQPTLREKYGIETNAGAIRGKINAYTLSECILSIAERYMGLSEIERLDLVPTTCLEFRAYEEDGGTSGGEERFNQFISPPPCPKLASLTEQNKKQLARLFKEIRRVYSAYPNEVNLPVFHQLLPDRQHYLMEKHLKQTTSAIPPIPPSPTPNTPTNTGNGSGKGNPAASSPTTRPIQPSIRLPNGLIPAVSSSRLMTKLAPKVAADGPAVQHESEDEEMEPVDASVVDGDGCDGDGCDGDGCCEGDGCEEGEASRVPRERGPSPPLDLDAATGRSVKRRPSLPDSQIKKRRVDGDKMMAIMPASHVVDPDDGWEDPFAHTLSHDGWIHQDAECVDGDDDVEDEGGPSTPDGPVPRLKTDVFTPQHRQKGADCPQRLATDCSMADNGTSDDNRSSEDGAGDAMDDGGMNRVRLRAAMRALGVGGKVVLGEEQGATALLASPKGADFLERCTTNDLMTLIRAGDLTDVKLLVDWINTVSRGWMDNARRVLTTLTRHCKAPVRHYIVSAGQLLPTVVKLCLFGLKDHFPIEHVYSSAAYGKKECFERILADIVREHNHRRQTKERRGDSSGRSCGGGGGASVDSASSGHSDVLNVRVCAIGDGIEEREAAHTLGIDFYAVEGWQDLYTVLRDFTGLEQADHEQDRPG